MHVAWMHGTSLKCKRFKVGAAPAYALTPRPTVVIFAALDGPTSAPILHLVWDQRFTQLDVQLIQATRVVVP